MRERKLAYGHRAAAGNLLDVIVRPSHTSVAIVDQRSTKMVDAIRRYTNFCGRVTILVERDVLEDKLATERFGQLSGHLLVIHLDGAREIDGCAEMALGGLEQI